MLVRPRNATKNESRAHRLFGAFSSSTSTAITRTDATFSILLLPPYSFAYLPSVFSVLDSSKAAHHSRESRTVYFGTCTSTMAKAQRECRGRLTNLEDVLHSFRAPYRLSSRPRLRRSRRTSVDSISNSLGPRVHSCDSKVGRGHLISCVSFRLCLSQAP